MAYNANIWGDAFIRPQSVPVTLKTPPRFEASLDSDNTAVGDSLQLKTQSQRVLSFGQPDSSIDTPTKEDDFQTSSNPRVPTHDQRTILITNLSDRVTHKDLVSVIRGGRLLDIFLRNDRSATISFVEGAHDFLAYAKRNDIYLQAKRVGTSDGGIEIGSLTLASSNSGGMIGNSMCHPMYPTRLQVERVEISSCVVQPGNSPKIRYATI